MPYSVVDKPSKFFETKLYTGNGSTQSIGGLSFSPDLVWVKLRSGIEWHVLNDSIRGATKNLYSNSTSAEITESLISSLNSDGFTVQNDLKVNSNGSTYVGWCWDANGAGVSNNSGTISSTVSANTTSGFSIVSYTGTGSNATVGHGLGVAPKMIIVKNRSAIAHWQVYHTSTGNTQSSQLSGTGTPDTASTYWNNTSPTSTLFSIGTGTPTNGSGNSIIAYCFAEVKGYSKFGSFVGNGSTDGSFVHLGFRPAFVMIKGTQNLASATPDWRIRNNKTNTFNPITTTLYANSSGAEVTEDNHDFLSNGFKVRTSGAENNYSGETYIYMAFAENPFVSSKGIPACAV